ncbi:two-component system response regulator [Rhodococcus sp. Leaf7]|uniref:response regulator n=1 Tax=unclassified Rhodococcus (in: high G+C Gram-positive bacteria) TaxID=192944 RepID=UPI0006F3487B|nr:MULTISPECIES: response regulator transcription factor [unclassified Rhodococcus (in: high G+C Gram-positive bacteria)]KQU03885.1 two-component system response regulator [Rhodococcus sp. Leaf7]KQU40069.1 two-component system response regulator [Rhodococcus sp. Leaf247]
MDSDAVITVLVVDDDAFVRRGVADIFAATMDIVVVGSVSDGDEVPAAVAAHRPDVVLMDLKMRRVDGLDATRALMASTHPPKVVAMTAMDVDDLVVQAIEAGAHSFLSKSEAPETFHQSIRAVAAGNTLFSEESLRRIVATTRPPRPTVTLEALTDKERTVLSVMASGATNADIARQLYMAETTVKSHLAAVNHKLHVTNRVEAALMAFRAGLVV